MEKLLQPAIKYTLGWMMLGRLKCSWT